MYLTTTVLALLSVLSSTSALPEPQTHAVTDADSLVARKDLQFFVFNHYPPYGKCRLSSFINKISQATVYRVTADDGSFITSGSCDDVLCTSPLLGLGDDLAIMRIDNAEWKIGFMRSGTVSGDRWVSTDTSRCTMFPAKPVGNQSVTVTCDFDCHKRYDWPLAGQIMGLLGPTGAIMKSETVKLENATSAEVAAPLVLPSGLTAPTS